jgi:hypothetical protein
MAMYVVFQWSVLPEDQGKSQELVAGVVEHIRTDHPEITSTKLYMQWTGPQPRRGFTWLEEYEDFAALNRGEITPACMEIWKPIERMAQPGTWTASVWFDSANDTSLTRAA